ncbi:hypothetical protein LI328DRAFT_69845 [Trichoderma asperelloides]|nr:hypothetical protein LI328DRAFT_69845 [Trichoderma asperelloides]
MSTPVGGLVRFFFFFFFFLQLISAFANSDNRFSWGSHRRPKSWIRLTPETFSCLQSSNSAFGSLAVRFFTCLIWLYLEVLEPESGRLLAFAYRGAARLDGG